MPTSNCRPFSHSVPATHRNKQTYTNNRSPLLHMAFSLSIIIFEIVIERICKHFYTVKKKSARILREREKKNKITIRRKTKLLLLLLKRLLIP